MIANESRSGMSLWILMFALRISARSDGSGNGVIDMKLEHMTWPQAEHYFKENDIVLITVGSCECHGRHMPLGTDTIIPNRILELIEEKSHVMMAPTIPYGSTQSLACYPGTIDIGDELLSRLLSSVMENFYRFGIRRFAILNGHGGNIKPIENVGFTFEERGCLVALLNWWLMAWDMNPAWKGGHGGGEETAGVMGVNPALVDRSEIGGPLEYIHLSEKFETTGFRSVKYKGVSIEILRPVNRVTSTGGWIGPDHPNTATEQWGREMLQTCADYIADLAEEFRKIEL